LEPSGTDASVAPVPHAHSCLRCGQKLVHGANLGLTLYALNDAGLDQGPLDDERTAAARRTLQQVFVVAPMHERIGQVIV
jgi:hypothetical protein